MNEKSKGRRLLRILVIPVLIGLVARRLARRRPAARRGFGDAGGEAAGVREPRNPLPTKLSGVGAAVPGE